MPESRRSAPPARALARGGDCILLFGMPRSGTTWLGKLFDSHPDTLYRHEPDTWRRSDDIPRYPQVADAQQYTADVRAFVARLPEINALRVAGKLPLFSKSFLSPLRQRLLATGVQVARAGSRVFPEFPVLGYRSGDGSSRRRVVWKSIESLGRLGVFLDVLPEARGIQILRHPCGYIASVQRGMKSQSFSDSAHSGSEDYGIFTAVIGRELGDRYALTHDYLRSLSPEERLAWRWALINEKAMVESESTGRWRCVRYEDICDDPVAGMTRLFEFTGLTMQDQTRAFIDASTSRAQKGYYSVFKDPQQSAWRWREELDAATVDRILAIVQQTRVGQYYSDNPGLQASTS